MTAASLLLVAGLKSTFVVVGAGFLARRRRLSAAARHRIWAAAFLMLLALPAASLIVPAFGSAAIGRLADAIFKAQPAIGDPGQPVGERALRVPDGGSQPALARPEGSGWGWLLGILWLAGVILILLRLAADQLAMWRFLRSCRPAAPVATRSLDLKILVSDAVGAPATAGWLRPAVILPGRYEAWSPDRLQAALAHEAAHVIRRDTLTSLLVELSCALYWFNPLVWLARGRLALECEKACDDQALISATDRLAYAAALLAIANESVMSTRVRGALTMADRSGMRERFEALIDDDRVRETSPRGQFTSAVLVSCLLLVPVAGLRPARAEEPSTPFGDDRSPSHTILVDPRTERLDLRYDELAGMAAAVEARGPDAAAIARLKLELDRVPEDRTDLVRERAIWVLLRARGGSIVDPLIGELGHRDWRVRAYAAWGLGASASDRAGPALSDLLSDPVWRVRANAAFALADIGGPHARAALEPALRDPVWQVRYAAVEFLGRQPDQEARQLVRRLLADPHAGTRLAAQSALQQP